MVRPAQPVKGSTHSFGHSCQFLWSYPQLPLARAGNCAPAHVAVQAPICRLGATQVHPRGNRFCRERRFSAEPRRNLQLRCVILEPDEQVRFLPALPLQFLGNDPLRLGLGTGPAPAQNLPEKRVPMVQPNGVSALQPRHPRHQVRFRGFQHQVVMIGHKTIRMHLPIGFLARFSQRLDEVLPVHVIQVNLLPPVATAHHVIHSPSILDAQLSRHADSQDYAQTTVNSQNGPSYGLTPLLSDERPPTTIGTPTSNLGAHSLWRLVGRGRRVHFVSPSAFAAAAGSTLLKASAAKRRTLRSGSCRALTSTGTTTCASSG